MIEPKEIKAMVKNVIRRDHGLSDPHIIHPTRDWFIGLSLGIVFIIAGGLYSTYLYSSYENFDFQSSIETETLTPYQAGVVAKAIAIYTEKNQEHNLLLQAQIPVLPKPELGVDTASSTATSSAATTSTSTLIQTTTTEPTTENIAPDDGPIANPIPAL